MRKSTRALTALATAAPTVGVAGRVLATTQARPLERVLAHAAFQPGSGQPVIDWNRELITLLGTPGLLPPNTGRLTSASSCPGCRPGHHTNGES
jgi:hypothetical protein